MITLVSEIYPVEGEMDTCQVEDCLDGRTRVYRWRGERHFPNCVQQYQGVAGIHHGGGTVLVHVTGALTGIKYRHVILQYERQRWNFNMTIPDHILHVLVKRFFSAIKSRPYFGLHFRQI